MPTFKILNEKPITMAELKEKLKELEKRKGELGFRTNKTKEYINSFETPKGKSAAELSKKIEALNVPRLKDRQIAKLMDIMPADLDSLKAVLSGENITIKDEDLKRILEVLNS